MNRKEIIIDSLLDIKIGIVVKELISSLSKELYYEVSLFGKDGGSMRLLLIVNYDVDKYYIHIVNGEFFSVLGNKGLDEYGTFNSKDEALLYSEKLIENKFKNFLL